MSKVTYNRNGDDNSSRRGPPSYSESDHDHFETKSQLSPTNVQLLKGYEFTSISSGRPSASISDRASVSSSRPSTSKVQLIKGMENIMTSRPTKYAIENAAANQSSEPYSPSWSKEAPRLLERESSDKKLLKPGNEASNVVSYDENAKSTDTLDRQETDREERDTWGNKAEFLLASIGLAVGLGNVWRFPYLCQRNGGGAFLIPYVIFMVIEGIPLMIMEFAIGQKMRMTAVQLWRNIHPALFGVGIGCIIISLLLCIYYVIVIAWCLFYFFVSMQKDLPWKADKLCDRYHEYNDLQGLAKNWKTNYTYYENMYKSLGNFSEPGYNETFQQFNHSKHIYTSITYTIGNFSDCCVIDPPQWYFYTKVLDISTDIGDYSNGVNGKLVGCLVLAWVIVYLCVVKGIKSSGKVVYFTATFPYIILIILFIRGVTLEGAGNGLKTFFYPEWERLKDIQVWRDAATQMFFTLSLAFGALIAFASYMPYHNQCVNDAYTVVFINCGTSIFAGVVVFSILGYRELKTGIKASEVGSGPGLAFMAFSDALLQLDLSPLWAVLFFIMLILLGIDSEFGTLEAVIGPLMELGLFPKKLRKEFCTAIVVVVLFLIGLSMTTGNGFYIFQIFDDYCATLPLLIVAFFQCIGVSWIYGNDKFADDIEDMTGKRPWIGWMICWKYISPLALFIVFIGTIYDLCKSKAAYNVFVGCLQNPFSDKYDGTLQWTARIKYPGWGEFLVALAIMASTMPIIFFIIYRCQPKKWLNAFHKTFCTGFNNYRPDPKSEDD